MPQASNEFLQKYKVHCEIGRGASGIVYKVTNNKNKQIYAMKKINVNSIRRNSTKEASNQVSILSKIEHPHVIKYYQSFADETSLYIIMQYAPKGDLHHILKRRKIKKEHYSEQQIWQMCRQVLSALQYLHKHSIIHRDVKTLNIFMDNADKLYVGDLGVSKFLKSDLGLYSRVGTPLYLAPEIIKYEKYDYKADIWGLGCVAYLLASLSHPFDGKNIITLGQNIVASSPKFIKNYSEELNKFISDMLEKNPSKRPGADELIRKYYLNRMKTAIVTPKEVEKQPIQQMQTQKQKQIVKQPLKIEKPMITTKTPLKHISYFKANHINNVRFKRLNNNFFNEDQQKIVFNEEDKIMQNSMNQKDKKITEKSLEDTVVLTKKIGNAQKQEKKSSEITYKQLNSYQEEKETQKPAIVSNKIINFSKEDVTYLPYRSQKKFPQTLDYHSSQLKNDKKHYESFSSIDKIKEHVNKKIQKNDRRANYSGFIDVHRFSQISSQNKFSKNRPKSSIINKDKYESTMKSIKRNTRKLDFDDIQKTLETRYLKKPEVIML